MTSNFIGEKWKEIPLNLDFEFNYKLEISNFGRIRASHAKATHNILRGTRNDGYVSMRLRFNAPRTPANQKKFLKYRKDIEISARDIRNLEKQKASKRTITEAETKHKELLKEYKQFFKADEKPRIRYRNYMLHLEIAKAFLPKPKTDEVVVGHLDYIKTNNHVSNLKWMTLKENYAHQQKSPFVIAEKKSRIQTVPGQGRNSKLTVTKVMLLKKLINEGKSLRKLSKQFHVTETQILRIKRGENWGLVKAAE